MVGTALSREPIALSAPCWLHRITVHPAARRPALWRRRGLPSLQQLPHRQRGLGGSAELPWQIVRSAGGRPSASAPNTLQGGSARLALLRAVMSWANGISGHSSSMLTSGFCIYLMATDALCCSTCSRWQRPCAVARRPTLKMWAEPAEALPRLQLASRPGQLTFCKPRARSKADRGLGSWPRHGQESKHA